MKFADKLAKLRKEKGWSQSELSKRVGGVHVGHLSRLENGKSQPSIELLWKLAQAFEVSTDFLLDDAVSELTPVSVQSKPLNERLELMEKLEEKDRQTIINVIDAMLTKKKMLNLLLKQEEVVSSR